MSYDNAISKRAQMNLDYQKMLESETDPLRKEAIQKQIKLNNDEILELRQGKPLFGEGKPLKQEITIIESDPETKGQKVTVVGSEEPKITEELKTEIIIESEASNKKIGNSLRSRIQTERALAAENSLKAKVQAAKAKTNQSQI